jgi:hypothetical protein
MKKLFSLILVSILSAGCSEKAQLIMIEKTTDILFSSIPEFYHITYIDLNTVKSTGWNKNKVTKFVEYPMRSTTNYNYQTEFDCKRRVARNLSGNWSGPWFVVEQSSPEYIMFPLVCGDK